MGMVPGFRWEIVELEFVELECAEIACFQNALASVIPCAALWRRPCPNRPLNSALPALCLAAQGPP